MVRYGDDRMLIGCNFALSATRIKVLTSEQRKPHADAEIPAIFGSPAIVANRLLLDDFRYQFCEGVSHDIQIDAPVTPTRSCRVALT